MPKLAKAGPRSQQEGNVYRTLGVLVLASTMGLTTGPAQTAQETPQSMQGFACDKPLGAVRDRQRSKPDRAVWVLKCGNATYRVSRAPDMAAKVEPLR